MRPTTLLSLLACIATLAPVPSFAQAQPAGGLQQPGAFASIGDSAARSRALFMEAAKVITSPRCMNCHPAGDRPTQTNDMHEHQPPVFRGDSGTGIAGNTCSACHSEHNYTLQERASYKSILGHPRWGMAPIE